MITEMLNTFQNSGLWKPDGKKSECGKRLKISNIVGGSLTRRGSFPYMALLGAITDDGQKTYYCGGSLINKWYVLTAAHCIAENWQNFLPLRLVYFPGYISSCLFTELSR